MLSIHVSRHGVNIMGQDGQKQLNIVVDPQQFGLVSLENILSTYFDLFKPDLGYCTITSGVASQSLMPGHI